MSSTAKDELTEYNKKLKAYGFIAITSLINVASIAEAFKVMPTNPTKEFGGSTRINLLWGLFTLFFSVLIIVIDVVDIIKNKFDFTTAMDGKVEGYTLLTFNLVWTAGVITLTRAGGIGYAALNVYFSTWITLFGCIHALDLWLGEKEYITIQKLCSLSLTLPYWWILWFASIIMFGSSADARRLLGEDDYESVLRSSCDLGIIVGVVSFCCSLFFILSHYEFLRGKTCTTWMTYGGIFELAVNVIVDIWQVIGIHLLTSAGKIGSSITGKGNNADDEDYVPGSNIFFASWCSLVASVCITGKWKQARAMKFAQTQNEVKEEEGLGVTDDDDEEI